MKSSEIRNRFVQYFTSREHRELPSSSLVPTNDPTLLFTNAGMVQFKDEFIGKSNPAQKRAVTVQKCVRAGGKHNDLENVGFTARHHTFFEMLGNFSFGDYFKREAIALAWEFLTEELKIPKDKLYVTVHTSDKEAAEIWEKEQNVSKDRIFFLGDKDNFWEMGEVGPCGPCSEIFYDHGPENSDPDLPSSSQCILDDEFRYVEIWNLVFMQFEKYKENGEIKKRDLPRPSVDTGAGLERLAAVMQNVYNNFDTDSFTAIIDEIEKISGKKYGDRPQWMRVVADHARSSIMCLADGVIPSNEGRGHVLRRIIRRAVRYLDLLGVETTSFYKLVEPTFEILGQQYPENLKNKDFIIKYLKLEEDGFRKTLSSGLKLLEKEVEELKGHGKGILSGKKAFVLYDTHGFPLDLTQMILKEKDLTVNVEEFEKEMAIQKERSKKSGDFSAKSSHNELFYAIKESKGGGEFVGYENLCKEATLLGSVEIGERVALIFDSTPFYPEGGGQAGDRGEIFDGEDLVGVVEDTTRPIEEVFAHIARLEKELEVGKTYTLKVDETNRNLTTYNHTATHLLQAALIKTLGDHIKQAGSSVGPQRLRFDFTHPEALKADQIKEVERLVNEQIKKRAKVIPQEMTKDEAMNLGAMALFGEKYGETVRVVNIPEFSVELCGGTHVVNTSDIGHFRILSEGSLSSGVRRIEGVTNRGAFDYMDKKLDILFKIENSLNSKDELLLSKVAQLQESLSESYKTIKSLKQKIQTLNAKDLFNDPRKIENDMVYKHIEASKDDDMRKLGDLFIDKFSNGIVLITCKRGEKTTVLLKTFKGNKNHRCSDLLKECLTPFSGKSGGKPEMAQGSLSTKELHHFVKKMDGLIV